MLPQVDAVNLVASRMLMEYLQELQSRPCCGSPRRTRPESAAPGSGPLCTFHRWPCRTVDSFSAVIAGKPGELLVQGTVPIGQLDRLLHDSPPPRLYLQTVVDAHSGLAFAKVYAGAGPLTAVDILEERVLPFYEKQAVRVEEVETNSRRAYCGRLLAHPYELFLKTKGIRHRIAHARADAPLGCLDTFQRRLRAEFLAPELRKGLCPSISQLQVDLDAFLEKYNHEPHAASASVQGRAPRDIFMEGLKAHAGAN